MTKNESAPDGAIFVSLLRRHPIIRRLVPCVASDTGLKSQDFRDVYVDLFWSDLGKGASIDESTDSYFMCQMILVMMRRLTDPAPIGWEHFKDSIEFIAKQRKRHAEHKSGETKRVLDSCLLAYEALLLAFPGADRINLICRARTGRFDSISIDQLHAHLCLTTEIASEELDQLSVAEIEKLWANSAEAKPHVLKSEYSDKHSLSKIAMATGDEVVFPEDEFRRMFPRGVGSDGAIDYRSLDYHLAKTLIEMTHLSNANKKEMNWADFRWSMHFIETMLDLPELTADEDPDGYYRDRVLEIDRAIMLFHGASRVKLFCEAMVGGTDFSSLEKVQKQACVHMGLSIDDLENKSLIDIANVLDSKWFSDGVTRTNFVKHERESPREHSEPTITNDVQSASTQHGHSCEAFHSPNFASVNWYGDPHTFSTNQALVVAVLWKAWEMGLPAMSQSEIFEEAKIPGERMNVVFRNHPAWKTMICASSKKGCYSLRAPNTR